MIKFIDIETGNVFEGAKPYIHWYEDGQSVNLIYVKELYIVSDNANLIVYIPNNGVFDLLDTTKVNSATQAIVSGESSDYLYDIYDNKYMKIDREEDDKITVCGDIDEENDIIHIASIGKEYNGYYVHKIYFIAKSQEAGEFREDFTVTTDAGENIVCTLGADFYNEDERLGISLKNFGMEAPSLVQRAIYDGNVHEEYQDNILINRKWKELLINYQDCLMNKGSYKSLINCLEWFGYGDTIRLTEYWRNAWNNGTLYEQDIKDTIYNITKELLRSNAKTTYIGILLALQKINPTHRYDEYEPIPEIVNRDNLLFFISDLCLKMTLLGNFFSTYFMPIHLDLIHCSIENLVFSTTLKILSEGENKVVAYNDSNEALRVKVDSAFKLMDVHTHVYVGPEFQQNGVENHATVAHKIVDEDTKMFGFETSVKQYSFTHEWQRAQYGAQMYGGPGCAVQFTCTIPNSENTSDFLITSIIFRVILEKETPQVEYIQTNINIEETPEIVFNYLFTKYGNYIVDIQMFSNIGKEYSRRVKFAIEEDVFNGIEIKKVIRRPAEELYNFADFNVENGLSIYSSYSLTDTIYNNNCIYSEYLYAGDDPSVLGMNSTIVLELECEADSSMAPGELKITFGDDEETTINIPESETEFLENLRSEVDWYIWTVRWAYTPESTSESRTVKPYLIGIRKNFTNSLEDVARIPIYQKELKKSLGYLNKSNKKDSYDYILNIKYKYFPNLIIASYAMLLDRAEIASGSTTVSYLDYKFSVSVLDNINNNTIYWEDTVKEYDYYDFYGEDKNKVAKLEFISSNEETDEETNRLSFNEERFIPVFHTISNIDDDIIRSNQGFVVIPSFKYMKPIMKNNVEFPLWTFHNATTGKDYYSETYQNELINISKPILPIFSPISIEQGYYDVILNMRLWENQNDSRYTQQRIESIVKVES